MVRITEQLIRKKSEHNEGIIGTLEELSLHQEDVEKIEHINNWCKEIQILYLQANLISKIENLNKLKKLQYLNLAINNIEKIENLERCESLEKLDLTLNFIGDLESVCSLRANEALRSLNLTGNPCADYEGYRDYVVAKLPQIEDLDSKHISRSERIKASQKIEEIEGKIRVAQENYRRARAEQKARLSRRDKSAMSDEEFWKSSSEHAPETRIEISERMRKTEKSDENASSKKKPVRLFAKDGRPMNVNQAKIPFTFNDENPEEFVLTVHVYKHLDTELIDVDLQPIYAKITIKDKVFQIVFPEDIAIDKSTCERSTTTGHLVLKMPKAYYKPKMKPAREERDAEVQEKREFLDVPERSDSMDYSRIVEHGDEIKKAVENQEIPPLELGY